MSDPQEEQFRKDTDEALELLRTPEWRQYVKFLERRVHVFQSKVNDFVEKGNLIDAKVSLALLKDSQKLAYSFKQQVLGNKEKLQKPEEKK